jgi:NAD(P)-dependent dehydrogenase (short-subunit alcohol dehydrogenase family)
VVALWRPARIAIPVPEHACRYDHKSPAAERDLRLKDALPAGRAGTVAEAAAAVLWLASPEAGSVPMAPTVPSQRADGAIGTLWAG